jgi:hypothetical protein
LWESISCVDQIHNVFDEHDFALWSFLMYCVVQHH